MFKVLLKLLTSRLTVYLESLEGSRFVAKFLDVLTMGTYKIYNVSKSMANTNSMKSMKCTANELR